MKRFHQGDPCPCCGQPIQTDDPERLLLLSCLAQYQAIRDAMKNRRTEPPEEAPDAAVYRDGVGGEAR